MDKEERANLRGVCMRATPGPWQWRFYGKHEGPDLVAAHSGMLNVMSFQRMGMRDAQPVFADRGHGEGGRWRGGIMLSFTEWWERLKDSPSRLAPDAQFMAAANPKIVIELLDEIDRLEAENIRLEQTIDQLEFV